MKTLGNAFTTLCVFYLFFLIVTAGVFAGLQIHGFAQNHVLVHFQELHNVDGTPYEHGVHVYKSDVSPFHAPVDYHLYMVAIQEKRDGMSWSESESDDKRVDEGTSFIADNHRFVGEKDRAQYWILVCSTTPLGTYEEVAAQRWSMYHNNSFSFNEKKRGYAEIECR
ncbi:hypothetical protein KA078_03325 [Candidatus Woesebacteria bacterium]|nr:hypothetical protein [Candidatus Woesebacteria bacterium]